jgi:general secretion pathway protein E
LEQQTTLKRLPFEFARSHQVLVDTSANRLLLGPEYHLDAVLDVRRTYGLDLVPESLDAEAFEKHLRVEYANRDGTSASVMEDIKDFVDIQTAAEALEETADLLSEDDDAPIIRLLNAILAEALREKASDIHVETYENEARVRFRLDGVLRNVLTPSVQIAPLLISRIKVMSRLDIAERRLPQDGRMAVRLGGRHIDLRVSTMPSSYGERIVMRLLDKNAGQLQVDDLGMPGEMRNRLIELVKRPHGIILVTGPTGSGKTTTLYAALQQLDRQQRNIMTVEDPVEYDLPGISQTQINLRAGMTFAKGLRAILRQDPDVILIGEIRDGETAEIATQASLTGHLVLSTLHTNTAAGAITRMQDLGVDSFLLSSTLRGILAQRLLRRVCQACRSFEPADASELKLLGLPEGAEIPKAQGCAKCNETGYDGRLGIFELVTIDAGLQRLIHDRSGETVFEEEIRKGTPSIAESGFEMVRKGDTTLEEVLRVTSA